VKKLKKNRPGCDVVIITQRQVKKKTNITHAPDGHNITLGSPQEEKFIRGDSSINR
jgi:hypothetical protein